MTVYDITKVSLWNLYQIYVYRGILYEAIAGTLSICPSESSPVRIFSARYQAISAAAQTMALLELDRTVPLSPAI